MLCGTTPPLTVLSRSVFELYFSMFLVPSDVELQFLFDHVSQISCATILSPLSHWNRDSFLDPYLLQFFFFVSAQSPLIVNLQRVVQECFFRTLTPRLHHCPCLDSCSRYISLIAVLQSCIGIVRSSNEIAVRLSQTILAATSWTTACWVNPVTRSRLDRCLSRLNASSMPQRLW
jgi:hypothetical protein